MDEHTPTDAPDAGIAAPEEVATGAVGLVEETLPPPALDPDDDPEEDDA